jgi:hypothetical protein
MTAEQKKYRSELEECDGAISHANETGQDSAEWATYRNELWAMEDTDGVVFRKQFEEPGRDVSNWPVKP